MIDKLPAWVGVGSFFLASTAGSLNVCTLQSVFNHPISHLSGASSSLGLSLAQGDTTTTFHLCLLILCFCAGSALSGFIIREKQLQLGRRYGFSLLIECFMILLSWFIISTHPGTALLILSAACGLQNAMATTYSGAVVRTTHLTGIFTDLGIIFGNFLAGIPLPFKKIILFTTIVAGFLFGGLISGLLFPLIGNAVLFYPATITGTFGMIYFLYRFRKKIRI